MQLILVGVIGAPHGVRGELRVKSFTGEPIALARYGVLRSQDSARAFEVVTARPLKDDMLVVRLKGVDTREAAAALTGLNLHVDRAALPPPDQEEFYHTDLIGMRAETAAGTPVGAIVAVANYGAGDLLDIVGPGGTSHLVPFIQAFVPLVDLAGGRVVLADAALSGEAAEASARRPEEG